MRHGHNRGGTPSAEYTAWLAAKKRCFNPRHPSFEQYGGRGIRMCPEWAENFDTFLRDMGIKPHREHSLDRIDPNGDYTPGNCRWASPATQARNKRNVRWYELRGERLILAEVAARLGITRDVARALERRGKLPARPMPRWASVAIAAAPLTFIDLNDVLPLSWPCNALENMAATAPNLTGGGA